MKIGFILASNIKFSPYVNYYLEQLNEGNVKYEIISWDRHNLDEGNSFCFKNNSSLADSIYKKIVDLIKYKRFIKKIVKENEFEKLVVFTPTLGILLNSLLLNKFRSKYILDIRDYSFVVDIFKRLFKTIMTNSQFVVVSSPGFKNWIDFDRAIISHNCSFSNFNRIKEVKYNAKDVYSILTIGSIRDYEANLVVLKAFANQEKFILVYAGASEVYDRIFEYSQLNNISNTRFIGAYHKDNELELYEDSDFVNVYLPDDLNSKTLMSNRFYNATLTGKPLLSSKGSTQGEFVDKYKIGITLGENDKILENVISYINDFDVEIYNKGRSLFKDVIQNDNRVFCSMLKEFNS